MSGGYEFEILSQYGEAWRNPKTLYRDSGSSEHYSALALMREVEEIAASHEGLSVNRVKRESTLEPTIDRHVGPKIRPSIQLNGGAYARVICKGQIQNEEYYSSKGVASCN